MKVCTKCLSKKSSKDFGVLRRSKDGLNPWCKECNRANGKRCYYENIPRVRKNKRDYYYNNRERLVEYSRAFGEKWRRNNPHLNASKSRKYQASKINATPPWLSEAQMSEIEQVYWLARDLKAISGQSYHVDHIVPLKGKNICGLHVPWNLQVLPSDINISKGNLYVMDLRSY